VKKFAKIFLSKEEKRQITTGNEWDLAIEEVQKTFGQPPLLDADTCSDQKKRRWVLRQLCVRQEWKCFWCGKTMTDGGSGAPSYRTLEHVVPKATKGKNINKLSNLRAACRECNENRSIWSSNKSLVMKITEQQQSIDLLSQEKDDLRTALDLTDTCLWCRFRIWVYNKWHRRRNEKSICSTTL
jgi:5-methylcytosine-specific restriction endonuclease McrA